MIARLGPFSPPGEYLLGYPLNIRAVSCDTVYLPTLCNNIQVSFPLPQQIIRSRAFHRSRLIIKDVS